MGRRNNAKRKESRSQLVAPGTTVTVCCLTLRNGFHVTGDGACIDPNMFDEDKGRAIALCNAKNKIWPLLAYKLKDKTKDEQAEINHAKGDV